MPEINEKIEELVLARRSKTGALAMESNEYRYARAELARDPIISDMAAEIRFSPRKPDFDSYVFMGAANNEYERRHGARPGHHLGAVAEVVAALCDMNDADFAEAWALAHQSSFARTPKRKKSSLSGFGAGQSSITFPSQTWGTVYVELDKYKTGNVAVQLFIVEEGRYEPLATLSVNLPQFAHMLQDSDEFFAKTWSENEDIAEDALKSKLFQDTGRFARTGYVFAPVWKISPLLKRMLVKAGWLVQ